MTRSGPPTDPSARFRSRIASDVPPGRRSPAVGHSALASPPALRFRWPSIRYVARIWTVVESGLEPNRTRPGPCRPRFGFHHACIKSESFVSIAQPPVVGPTASCARNRSRSLPPGQAPIGTMANPSLLRLIETLAMDRMRSPFFGLVRGRVSRRGCVHGTAGHASLAVARDIVGQDIGGPPGYPFTLGIASGDPWPDGVVQRTRLAPNPTAEDGATCRRTGSPCAGRWRRARPRPMSFSAAPRPQSPSSHTRSTKSSAACCRHASTVAVSTRR